jgi:pimeloyl-ACP methyl ester carboxylesterase
MQTDATDAAPATQRSRRGLVIALHCSGGGASQWRRLGCELGADYELVAPEHYGCDSIGAWTGEHRFTLADEAARTIALIDRCDRQVHLVGHSYGGGLALHIALRRLNRIASLALYEPAAFHLLNQTDTREDAAFAEIVAITRETGNSVITGDYRKTAACFIDYWSGPSTWGALPPIVQRALTRWAPKAPLDFQALIEEPTPASAYAALRVPVLVLRGEHAPAPTRHIAETLPTLMPRARLAVIAGAGHLGPLSHSAEVSALMVSHIAAADSDWHRGLRPLADAANDAATFAVHTYLASI